jgi:hypothetical protein
MSDLEAEIISSQSSELWISKGELARLGGVESLFQILGLNSYIKVLDLVGCGLGDEGARVIAEMLKSNSTLLEINLSWNRIGDDGALAIAEMLRVNSTC